MARPQREEMKCHPVVRLFPIPAIASIAAGADRASYPHSTKYLLGNRPVVSARDKVSSMAEPFEIITAAEMDTMTPQQRLTPSTLQSFTTGTT